jgi:nucleotide-binding universal stress UspA family protein
VQPSLNALIRQKGKQFDETVSEPSVTHHGHRYIMLGHERVYMKPSHVLVPLDGSPLAEDALRHAIAVHGCRITVLNVVTPIEAGMSEGNVLETDEEREEKARKRAENLVEDAKEETDTEEESETTVEVVRGDPAEEILDRVEESDIDHVVMGSHGGERGALTRRLLGTVSSKVVSEAPVSVTVVR